MSKLKKHEKSYLIEGIISCVIAVILYLFSVWFVAYVGEASILKVIQTPLFAFLGIILIIGIIAYVALYFVKLK